MDFPTAPRVSLVLVPCADLFVLDNQGGVFAGETLRFLDGGVFASCGEPFMFRLDTNWASDDPTDAEVADWWRRQPDAIRDGYLRRARAALEAAR